jgi:hypothetical protein
LDFDSAWRTRHQNEAGPRATACEIPFGQLTLTLRAATFEHVPREYDSTVVRYSVTNPLTLSCDLSMPELLLPPNQPVAWYIRLALADPWA